MPDARGMLPWDLALALAGGHEATLLLFEANDWPKTAWTADSTRAKAAARHERFRFLLEELGAARDTADENGAPTWLHKPIIRLSSLDGLQPCKSAIKTSTNPRFSIEPNWARIFLDQEGTVFYDDADVA